LLTEYVRYQRINIQATSTQVDTTKFTRQDGTNFLGGSLATYIGQWAVLRVNPALEVSCSQACDQTPECTRYVFHDTTLDSWTGTTLFSSTTPVAKIVC
jgi:hypothetical protein